MPERLLTPEQRRAPALRDRLDRLAGAARRHPDLVALAAILLVALIPRLLILHRTPLFVTADSYYYYRPGYGLAHGLGFELPAHRTPGYPLFLAAVILILGQDLQAVAFVQHILGALTAALAYLIGRAAFGRRAGLAAGLLTALSGPLLVHERHLLSETLFTFLLALAVWLCLVAPRGGARPSLAAGLVLGLAFQARPIAQAVLPALWLATLLQPDARRHRLARLVLLTLGFGGAVLPTLAWNQARGGEAAPSTGTFLYDRLVLENQGFVLPPPGSPPPAGLDQRSAAARRLVLEQAWRATGRKEVRAELQRSLGLTETQANAAMRDLALEVLLGQPDRYLAAILGDARQIMLGRIQNFGRYRIDELLIDWRGDPAVAHVLTPPTEVQRREEAAAELLIDLLQPAQHRALLGALLLLGLLVACVRSANRSALALWLATLAMVIPSAALVGPTPRVRYPADPLLAVLVGGGLTALLSTALAAFRRLRDRWQPARPTVAPGQVETTRSA